jgi:predicted DNA-binding transcriptional regulator AlpA
VRYLPGKKVCERYGVTPMTLYRWLKKPELGFPRPIYIGRYRFWDEGVLEAFEDDLPRRIPPRYDLTSQSSRDTSVASTLPSTPNTYENAETPRFRVKRPE